jgi:hypothetical protein
MINRTLSILASCLYFVVAGALIAIPATWWLSPLAISVAWVGWLLMSDALAEHRDTFVAPPAPSYPPLEENHTAEEPSEPRIAA